MIFSTFLRFSTPLFTMCLSLYTIYFVFANFGMLFFSAKITTISSQVYNLGTPPLYYLMNFNDFPSSFVTLFHIMIVNNWFVTCNMYCYVMQSKWPAVYFILFWAITVLIMLNLVISFVMEVYDKVSQEIISEFERREYVIKLQQKFKELEKQPII